LALVEGPLVALRPNQLSSAKNWQRASGMI
jgi:hypothetical protein